MKITLLSERIALPEEERVLRLTKLNPYARLPQRYLAIEVRASIRPPLPPEFQGQEYPHGYVWSPPNYERFVDRCAMEIRQRLGIRT